MIVGFQGEAGAFSEEAALALLGDCETRGFTTFDDLVHAVEDGTIPLGLLPCENSIYGSITRSYDLLWAAPEVRIVDETTHAIEQCLIGLPNASLENIECIASHPVALEQCRKFLSRHPNLRIDVAADTAGSVADIVRIGNVQRAAIGPALAAQRYGAVILERSVQDDPDNCTRFFLIARSQNARRTPSKACLALCLPHRPGSLHEALGVFSERGLNLRSLVPRPSRKSAFEYVFFVEIDAPPTIDVEELPAMLGRETRILGRY